MKQNNKNPDEIVTTDQKVSSLNLDEVTKEKKNARSYAGIFRIPRTVESSSFHKDWGIRKIRDVRP